MFGFNKNLNLKVAAVVAVVGFSLSVIQGGVLAVLVFDRATEERDKSIESLMGIAANALESALYQFNNRNADDIVNNLSEEPSILIMMIEDDKGNDFASKISSYKGEKTYAQRFISYIGFRKIVMNCRYSLLYRVY